MGSCSGLSANVLEKAFEDSVKAIETRNDSIVLPVSRPTLAAIRKAPVVKKKPVETEFTPGNATSRFGANVAKPAVGEKTKVSIKPNAMDAL